MINLKNYINIEVNSFLRANTVDQKIKESIFTGKIDLIDEIEECDVILGNYIVEEIKINDTQLQNTEYIVYNVGESLINARLRDDYDVFDIRSTLEYISGSAGFKSAHTVICELNIEQLNLLIGWMYAFSRLRFSSLENLKIAINANDEDQNRMKVADIIDYYFLEHQGKGNLLKINATVVPSYYWIQKLKREKEIRLQK